MFGGAMRADNRNIDAIRRERAMQREVVKVGDIASALHSSVNCEREYARMAKEFAVWSDSVKRLERERRESVETLKEFSRNAERLMGDSMRVTLIDCESELVEADVNTVTDDERWCALLARIAAADTMNQVKMTAAAYKIAVKSIGSFASKELGLRAKMQMDGGATQAERETSERLICKVVHAKDVITKRKDALVEMNLKAKAKVAKFIEAHTIKPGNGRGLTDEEKAALAGLV